MKPLLCVAVLFGLLALATAAPRQIPVPIYGVTIDDITPLAQIEDSLKSFAKFPTSRIVFDYGVDASYYTNAISRISKVSYIMGQILDSDAFSKISVADFKKRVDQYLGNFSSTVDVWEVANEINGEWLGDQSEVVAKMEYAYNQVKKRGLKAAVTLYLNVNYDNTADNCWSNDWENYETWARDKINAEMKKNLDYVLISFYEHPMHCPLKKAPNWPGVYKRLSAMFPNSSVGFGECGAPGSDDDDPKSKPSANAIKTIINRYYSMTQNKTIVSEVPHYIGGYFYWHFNRDMLPKKAGGAQTKAHKQLNKVIKKSPKPVA